jgi:hypothetical protein
MSIMDLGRFLLSIFLPPIETPIEKAIVFVFVVSAVSFLGHLFLKRRYVLLRYVSLTGLALGMLLIALEIFFLWYIAQLGL